MAHFKYSLIFLMMTAVLLTAVAWKTTSDLLPMPETLAVTHSPVRKAQILDRHATPLTVTYQNDWNIHDYVPLYEIPEILQKIFIIAEDKRFFQHHGVDWTARWHAMLQNGLSGRIVRGASTITEQTVRMLHPRPRIFWSRWVEGFEAVQLNQRFSKADILEFYLNQVPYAHQRRGVVQAARYYFDRDLTTLNLKEMMVLAVLVRSPSRMDLRHGTKDIERPIKRLAERLLTLNLISETDYQTVLTTSLQLHTSNLTVNASHFVNYLYTQLDHTLPKTGHLHTTLNAPLQQRVQQILEQRINDLRRQNVNNGAVLVVDHTMNEVLAYVNAGIISPKIPTSQIDTVTTPRQPGSTLKPFLYALALEKGWTAATLIADEPTAAPVGSGMHSYRNYSRNYYGALRLRDALGNSLNIPAIQTVQFVGADALLQRLHRLGFSSLTAHPDYYGDGLALGNGAVTLLELVHAYTALANKGQLKPLKMLQETTNSAGKTVFTPEVASLIANILSDSDARRLEFGRSDLLQFPVQTAIKTGTSTDYRDAWAVGFNHRYTVGVWLGNLDQQPMLNISGSSGAALILRSVLAELIRNEETQSLYLSPKLVKVDICRDTGLRATSNCPNRVEWFIAGSEPPLQSPALLTEENEPSLYLRQPTEGLQLAMDPRIPDDKEAFALMLSTPSPKTTMIEWMMDDEIIATTSDNSYLWNLQRGTHLLQARVWQKQQPFVTQEVMFHVK